MAYAPLPKLIPINSTRIYPKGMTKTTLSEILQSGPVKRLFNQPNIVIETIPVGASTSTVLNKSISTDKRNGANRDLCNKNQPEVSILPIKCPTSERKEDVTVLPSKTEGKSEITLLPIKHESKQCGHLEPCENIICDVAIQQYVDNDGVSLMLAVNIEEDEINAPVSKHCRNERCDALSIDHNRCRRALIKLRRCDKFSACDICGISLKTRKSQLHHRNCKRKEEYRHNENDGAQILKDKMRERELQMIEATRMKRNEYIDSITGYNWALETLKKNEEIIVIPKTTPPQQPIITITSIPNPQSNQQFSNVRSVFGKILPSIPIVFPPQGIVLGKRSSSEVNSASPPKQTKLPEFFNNTLVSTSLPISTSQNQFIKVSGVTQSNFIHPITINNWVMSQAQIVGTTPIQPKPLLAPIRVVPITSLKSQPSLLHQTQGIPRFCIMTDNTVKPTNIIQAQTILPTLTPDVSIKLNSKQENKEATKSTRKYVHKVRTNRHQIRSEDKNGKTFMCDYCPKRFSTDWYFKMHIARHKGEMLFTCKTCEKPFSNRYDMKKHMLNDHKEGEVRCDVCGHISLCNSAMEIHIRSHTGERPFNCEDCDTSYRSSSDLKTHQRKRHGLINCTHCNVQLVKSHLKDHLMTEHDMTDEEAEEEFNQDQYKNGNISEGFDESKENLREDMTLENSGTVETKIKKERKDELEETSIEENNLITNKSNGIAPKEATVKGKSIRKRSMTKRLTRRKGGRRSKLQYRCSVCKESFGSAGSLQTHLTSKPKESVECRDCRNKFHTQIEYNEHSDICRKKAISKTPRSTNETSTL